MVRLASRPRDGAPSRNRNRNSGLEVPGHDRTAKFQGQRAFGYEAVWQKRADVGRAKAVGYAVCRTSGFDAGPTRATVSTPRKKVPARARAQTAPLPAALPGPPAAPRRILAYIDESGAKTATDPRQRFFLMSAVLINEEDRPKAIELLARIRADTKRPPGTLLHWRNIRKPETREVIALAIGAAEFLRTITVVVAHDYLEEEARIREEQSAYVSTLQFLIERMSWFGQAADRRVSFCMERIVRLTDDRFEMLLSAVRAKKEWNAFDGRAQSEHHAKRSGTKWNWIGAHRLDSPKRVELLQLADLVVSGTANAFVSGERRWLDATRSRIWRRPPLSTYGMKIHPWGRNSIAQADFAWVNGL